MLPEKYKEIYNYLTSASNPDGMIENMKRSIRKNAKRYKLCSGKLFYYWNQIDKPSIVIQDSQVQSVLRETHDDCGHQCYRYTYNLARDRYFWPGMTKTIKEYEKSAIAVLAAMINLSLLMSLLRRLMLWRNLGLK